MRNALLFLGLTGAVIVAMFVLVPVLGVLFLIVALLLVLAVGAFLAAPLLAKLPWFRDRITVEKYGQGRTIRFGLGIYTSYSGPGRPDPGDDTPPAGRLGQGDVIDVEGRELPDDDD